MIDFLITKMHDARFMTMLLAAIAASATAYTLIMPLFAGEGLAKRMKAVASERERLRQRERERLTKSEKVSLRQTPKQLVSKVVEDFNLTKWLAQEAARAGITVNAICPGYINTGMVQAVAKDVLEKSILPLIPIGRLGEPEEIARCVVFLASDEAGLIPGSTLTANGGQYFI